VRRMSVRRMSCGACRAAHVDLMREHGLPRTVPYLALTIARYPVGRRTKDA
jgi:hypothetical protein